MKNKICIVTGGTGWFGRSIVNALAASGAKIYVPARNLGKFNKIFDNSQTSDYFALNKIFSFECDITDPSSVNEFIEKVSALNNGRIDILINCAGGIQPEIKVEDLTLEKFNVEWNMNFITAFNFSVGCLKYMKINNYGRIVSIGSMASLQTTAGRFAYSAAKTAVINLMDTISEENKEKNIRCNTIIPSIIDTPDNREWGSEEDIRKWVKPDEISGIIMDLVSDKYSSVRQSLIKVFGNF